MFRSWSGIALSAVLLLILGGCGSGRTASASSGSPAPVRLEKATVQGRTEQVLATQSGMTLYYFDKDSATQSNCSGQCARIWPPLLVQSGTVRNPTGIPGAFTVVRDTHGEQLSYNGHLLYTFAQDSAPGQTKGQGVKGVWWVSTPGPAPTAAGSGSSGSSGW